MAWLRRLLAGSYRRARVPALVPRDCPSCWRARTHALHLGTTRCGGCGKWHRARRGRPAHASL